MGREVRDLLRTRDGQTTGREDGESLLDHITTGRRHRKTEKQYRETETENHDYFLLLARKELKNSYNMNRIIKN